MNNAAQQQQPDPRKITNLDSHIVDLINQLQEKQEELLEMYKRWWRGLTVRSGAKEEIQRLEKALQEALAEADRRRI